MNNLSNKVLIVEDSCAINDLLRSIINTELYIDTMSADSFKEAKKILDLHSDQFFVAILDLNLPDAPNGEIVDLVLERDIPPIILTATISDDLHDEMIGKPIIDYVVKLNLNEIRYVIETVKRLRDNMERKVMVVDDSKSSRQLLSVLLKRQYLNVIVASNGEEALQLLAENEDILLIVTDYNMPVMNGAELIAKVREKFSRNEIAVIGISTTGSGTTSIKLLKSGANDFIARPFMHEEFYCRINHNIDSIVSHNRLRDAADRDFLTGLYNRKYLYSAGEKLFQNGKRNHITLMVAVLDIDYFKVINDTHGHHVGDLALKHITSIFIKVLRKADIITRIGGEEFCLLCVNIDGANSEKLLERYRKTIMDSPLVMGELSVSMTISIGYTLMLKDSLEQMIKDADSALYAAKEAGRNLVLRYEAAEL